MNNNTNRNSKVNRKRKNKRNRRPANPGLPAHMINDNPVATLVRDGGEPIKVGRRNRYGKTLKFFDSTYTTYTPSTSGVLQNLTTISQGVTESNRVGDICHLKHLVVNYNCNAANADVFSSVRVVIFQWRSNIALIAPVVTDIFQIAADGIGAMFDVNYSDMFTILYDKLHSFSGTFTAPTASSNQNWAGYIDLTKANCKINFAAGSATGSNFIYLLAISDSAIAPFPNLVLKSRVFFYDH